jgi:hypothetical protein
MAVKSMMKSSGLAALAVGIATMALPVAASAQEGNRISKSEFVQQRQAARQEQRQVRQQPRQEQRQARQEQRQVRQEPQQGNARNWQGRGNGAERGNGGNWQNRGDGGARTGNWTPGRPQGDQQARQQREVDTANRSAWQQLRDRQTETRNQQRRWDRDGDRNRGDRRWDGNRDGRWDGDRNDRRRYDNDRRWDRDGRNAWNRDWRRDNRYNWYNYRNTNRHVFRLGRYYSPYNNWSYRRLNIGFFLQPLFYSSSYWINDPWQYRLPEVYGPYRWVRYYDDALLVDVYTGEVVDVIYDFFW